jgi:hypothetical protein
MRTKSLSGLGVIVASLMVAISAAATLSAYAQNVTTTAAPPQPSQNQTSADPQQIKNYLTQAIQALDSGNTTSALEQVDLAEDQLESMTGTEYAEDDDDDEEEEEGEIEEGPGEDEDEPGDIDTNDEEDTP